MITISKQDNGVLFTFENSDKYLYGNGTIEVPFNSLSIVVDESDMITLKKAASNDIFLSARYDTDLGYRSKDDAIDDLKGMLFAETGGGSGSGVTPSEVQEMIDESISGKADTSAVTAVDNALSAHTSNTHVHVSSQDKYNWNNKAEMSAVTAVANDVSTLSGQVATKVATSDFNAYSAATDARLAEDEEVTAAALNNLDETKQGKLVYYEESTEEGYADIYVRNDDGEGNVDEYSFNLGTGSVDLAHYNQYDDGQGNSGYSSTQIQLVNPEINLISESEENGETEATNFKITPTGVTINDEAVVTEDQLAGYQPVLSAGTGIDITDNVISATGGGGATYSAGRNISIDTANTINCTLNLSNGSGNRSIAGGQGSSAAGENSIAFGSYASINQAASSSFSFGHYTESRNKYETSLGEYNVSNRVNFTFGNSGNTLFSVGNGASASARHNAFEIRQNGDIYVNDGTNDVRLQDTILALGGLKFVQCTQAEYDALVSGGTVDSSTIYFITNVVS